MTKPRRRWPRALLWVIGIFIALFYVGGGLYFSEQLRADGFTVKPHQREYRATVASVGSDVVSITQGDPADGELFNSGLMGLVWQGGYGSVEDILDQTDTEVTRSFVLLGGDPPTVGTEATWIHGRLPTTMDRFSAFRLRP